MILRGTYEWNLMVRLYQLFERGKRLTDREFILFDYPRLMAATKFYIEYKRQLSFGTGCTFVIPFRRSYNFGKALRKTNETIFDMCMLDGRRGKNG